MTKTEEMAQVRGYTIFSNPRDFPDKYVVRGWAVIQGGRILQDAAPLAVRNTLQEARAALPPNMCRLSRAHDEDPVIVEVWMW